MKYLLEHIEEYQNGILVNNKQDEVLRERVIDFDEMFEYLNKDPEFRVQNSYDPAIKLIE